jgi:hypothetical protein
VAAELKIECKTVLRLIKRGLLKAVSGIPEQEAKGQSALAFIIQKFVATQQPHTRD